MKVQHTKFVYQQQPLKSLLFEQEDPLADEEPPGEEGETDEEAPADESEEELEVEPEEEVKLSKSVDQDLEALLIDFETQARKSQEIETASEESTITVEEGISLSFLLEQDEEPAEEAYREEIDLDRFGAEVARLVKNYTSLLDMEKMLVNKSREFVVTRHGEEAEKELLNILADKHDIEIVEPHQATSAEFETPVAVGAGAGAAGEGG